LNEVGVMPRGRGSERRPWLGIALEGSYLRLATDGGPFYVC
jgi:hypothetical protein